MLKTKLIRDVLVMMEKIYEWNEKVNMVKFQALLCSREVLKENIMEFMNIEKPLCFIISLRIH